MSQHDIIKNKSHTSVLSKRLEDNSSTTDRDSNIVEPDSTNPAIIQTLRYSSHSKSILIISIPFHTWLGKMIKNGSQDTILTKIPKPLVDILQLTINLVNPKPEYRSIESTVTITVLQLGWFSKTHSQV